MSPRVHIILIPVSVFQCPVFSYQYLLFSVLMVPVFFSFLVIPSLFFMFAVYSTQFPCFHLVLYIPIFAMRMVLLLSPFSLCKCNILLNIFSKYINIPFGSSSVIIILIVIMLVLSFSLVFFYSFCFNLSLTFGVQHIVCFFM